MLKRWLVILLLAALALPNLSPAAAEGINSDPGSQASQALFIENVGQFHPDVRYLAYLEEGLLYVTHDSLWLSVLSAPEESSSEPFSSSRAAPPSAPSAGAWVKVSFTGANSPGRIESADSADTPYSYFLGSQPENWHSAVPVWNTVRMVDLYPGLTLELSAPNGQLRMQAQAQDATALKALRIQVEGAQTAALETGLDGSPRALLLETPAGTAHFPLVEAASLPAMNPTVTSAEAAIGVSSPYTSRPEAAQSKTGGVKKWYQYSTFLGGSEYDDPQNIVTDKQGSAYVTGWTYSPNFPSTPGAFDPSLNGWFDTFVVHIDPSGKRLLYATFLGGTGFDYGLGLAVDSKGSVYISGETNSEDFPITPGAFRPALVQYPGMFYDAFIAQLNPGGTALVFSTYLGGNKSDIATALTVDKKGMIYVTGWSDSPDFPLTPDALDTYVNYYQTFLTVFQPGGRALVYSTFLGGYWFDEGHSIYADDLKRVYIAGNTDSEDFPVTTSAFDTHASFYEGFVACYDLTQPKLIYATLLGGESYDWAFSVAADRQGYAYVAGITSSPDFPTTTGAFDTTLGGETDVFITKLAPDGRSAVYSTLLGGSEAESEVHLSVDRNGAVYLAGETSSSDFPVTPGAFDVTLDGGIDVFIVKLSPDARQVLYSTFLGGSSSESPNGLSLSANGSLLVAGLTHSYDFPITPGVVDPWFNEYSTEGFVTRLWVQDHLPKDPALMTADERYLEEEEAVRYRIYLPAVP